MTINILDAVPLQASVEDTCLKFDEAVTLMISQKLNMDSQVYQMEFRVIRLLYSVEICQNFSDEEETRLMLEAEQLRLKRDHGSSALTDTRHKVCGIGCLSLYRVPSLINLMVVACLYYGPSLINLMGHWPAGG